ncbi:outer membrane lipoprotein chaperone LolA [Tepidicella baoligensis]|uniref:outer membrane lipoprotein chaperone LolA n=1 Tax=Tepidicella baoligensis TaxID=2707016 RepID=UPI001FE4F0F6|nr:outer membrane lipoprotein chaperone LolA [Tepidicella baoligensis]
MQRRSLLLAVACCGVGVWFPAHADGLSALESFLRQTQQGRAAFTQTVTAPRKDGEAAPRARTSRGVFEFQRPDRFRFVYTHPFEQTIVADGQTLWLYDVDLNQVTARAQQEALGQTPAALIAASPDLRGLTQVFDLRNAPDADGLTWVLATPKQRDGQLQWIQLGFRQGQLAALDILDSFGQRSTIRFEAMDTQPGFGAEHFRFQPPAGADVIRQ